MGTHTRDRGSPCSQILICNVSNYLLLRETLRTDKKKQYTYDSPKLLDSCPEAFELTEKYIQVLCQLFSSIFKNSSKLWKDTQIWVPKGSDFGRIFDRIFSKTRSKTGKSRYLEIQGELGEGMVISRCTTTAPTGFKPVSGPSEHFFPSKSCDFV